MWRRFAERPSIEELSADLGHGAVGGDGVFGESVAPGFVVDGFAHQRHELVGSPAGTEGFAEVHFVFAEETESENAIGHETESVAAGAEGVADGADETEGAFGAAKLVHAGFAIELAVVDGNERAERSFNVATHVGFGDDVLLLERGDAAEGHHFDEAHLPIAVEGEPGEGGEVAVVVEAADGDGVDFDAETGAFGGFEAGEDVAEIAPASDLAEAGIVEGVEADVDAGEAGFAEGAGEVVEENAVGGEADGLDAGGGGGGADEFDEVAAERGFAAGEADFLEAEFGEEADEGEQFVVLQEGAAGAEGHVLGHAIDTAQVAGVGQRDAQVIDGAAVLISCHGVAGCRW